MKALSFGYTAPQLTFKKHDGLHFEDSSLKKLITFNTMVDVEHLTSLLVHSKYFLLNKVLW